MIYALKIYQNSNGKNYFLDWLIALKDIKARAIIRARLNRIELGNFGDCKSIGEGISELRINYSSGFRVYFGRHGETVVVLLCGGDKASQKRDIVKAKVLWKEYKDGTKKLS